MRWTAMLIALILAVSIAKASPLVKVEVYNKTYYESLTILNPKSGNWMTTVGGHKVVLPSITFVYTGIKSAVYRKGDKTIRITTYGIKKVYRVKYPFTTASYYYPGERVSLKIYVERDLNGKTGYLYVVRTGPMAIRNAISRAVDGKTRDLRNMLSKAVFSEAITLRSGRVYILPKLGPGDYVAVLLLNKSSTRNVTFVSATAFEIFENKARVKVRKVIRRRSVSAPVFVSGTFEIVGGSPKARYTYIATLIHSSAYSLTVKLECGGNKKKTNLYVNGAEIVKGWCIGGVGLSHVNSTVVYNWLKNAFPPNRVSIAKESTIGNVYYFSLPVKGLPNGVYYLEIAAWNVSNPKQRVVAFAQEVIRVVTVRPIVRRAPPMLGAGGGGMLITAPPKPKVTPRPTPKPTPKPTVVKPVKPVRRPVVRRVVKPVKRPVKKATPPVIVRVPPRRPHVRRVPLYIIAGIIGGFAVAAGIAYYVIRIRR